MLLAFGSNGSGQLGIGHDEDVSHPVQTLTEPDLSSKSTPEPNIRRIAAGGNHTLVLYDTGRVYAVGNNDNGRCGFLDEMPSPLNAKYRPMTGESKKHQLFKDISASWSASFLVAQGQDQIFACGGGEHGELGLGRGTIIAKDMQPIVLPELSGSIQHIASCLSHTVIVLSNGEVWGWGNGRKGQIGMPNEDVWTPRRISEVKFFATRAVCGKDFTCVIGREDSGELLMLGPARNDRFRLRVDAPQSVPDWKDISASWGSVFVLLKDGGIICWGRNDRGQLPPVGLPKVKAIAAGSEHCLAVTLSDEVFSWGWGEHGNCGIPTDERGVVNDRWNEIELPYKATAVFAGCATSFIEVARI